MPASSSPTGRGSPLRDDERPAVDVLHAVQRGDDGRGGVVHVGGVDQGRPGVEQRQPAAAGTVQRPVPPAACRRGPRRCAGAPPRRGSPARPRPAPAVRPRPWCGSSRRARGPGPPARRPARRWRPRSGPRTGRRRTRGPHAGRAGRTSRRRVPSTFTSSKSAARPVKETFAARWMTPSAPATARRTASSSVMDPARSAAPATPGGTALERGDGVALPRPAAGHRAAEQAARAGDEDPHGVPGRPPASTADAHRDRRVRSILELWRMSVGREGTASTAETLTPAGGRRPVPAPASCGAAGPARRTGGTVSTTATTACVPAGPTPTTAAQPDVVQAFDGLLGAHGRDHSARRRHDVREASLHPEPAGGVEVPDVAGAVPSGPCGRSRAGSARAGRRLPSHAGR